MTAHPVWPQSQYEQNRAGLSSRVRGAPAEGVTRRRYEQWRSSRSCQESLEGTPNLHCEATTSLSTLKGALTHGRAYDGQIGELTASDTDIDTASRTIITDDVRAACDGLRSLWTSTGVKNPAYPDTMYITELVAPHIVSTIPEKTLEAVANDGCVRTAAPWWPRCARRVRRAGKRRVAKFAAPWLASLRREPNSNRRNRSS
jgi:transaldolase/fructose-6-phosphate aldolase-like protein